MIVGRERGLLEALSPALATGTRYELRRNLEAVFWDRIRSNIVEGHWRVFQVSSEGETCLGRYQITALDNPFDVVIAAGLAGTSEPSKLVFQAINAEATFSERQSRESEASDYIRAWAKGRDPRIPVELIDAEIKREFKRYNFGVRAVTRIRMAAGLKQKRGNFSTKL
jgi:hypothetical protein